MKIMIIGSFMNDNFGDYLIYHESMKCLNEVCTSKDNVFSVDVSEFYDRFELVHRRSHRNAVKEADVIVFTGGGYFGEGDRKKLLWDLFFVRYYGLIALRVAFSKKPYAIIGVGAGPFKYAFARWLTKFVFNRAELISVRDDESKEFLQKIGVKNQISVHCDWILGMDTHELLQKKEYVEQQYNLRPIYKYLLVHLISDPQKTTKMNLVIGEVIDFLAQNPNYRVIVSCDQTKADLYERTNKLADEFNEYLALYYEYKSPWELAAIIGKASIVLTDKLHVGIAAINMGIPVVSVPLHSKTPRFYKQIKREQFCKKMELLNKGMVMQMLCEAKKDSVHVDQYKECSNKNRTMVKEFIISHALSIEK